MRTPNTITLNIKISDVITDAKRELAILAKRAKDANGKPIFSDLTPSSNELGELNASAISASQTLAHAVNQYIGSCVATEATVTEESSSVSCVLISFTDTRLPSDGTSLQARLEPAVVRYLSASAVGYFLTVIHPWYGMKYPPQYSQIFTQSLPIYLSNIIALLNDKEPMRLPKYPYTESLLCQGTTVTLKLDETDTITYDIDADCEDDIIAEPEFRGALEIHKCPWHAFQVTPKQTGSFKLRLYSMHNEEIEYWLDILVEE